MSAKSNEERTMYRIISSPVIESPLSRFSEHLLTSQFGKCRELEIDFMRCASIVGKNKSYVECKLFKEDLDECLHATKANKRVAAIQKERKKTQTYIDPPPKDSVRTWHHGQQNDVYL